MYYAVEDFTLDTDRRELRRDATLLPVEPQVFDLIAFLIANRNRVISRDDLLDAVWHGRIVSESTLATRINAARRALGDSGEAQRLIRTIHRRGFRFVGNIIEKQARDVDAMSAQPTLAVLPFLNMSGDAEQDYFVDGLTEDIISALSRFKSFAVISGNSSFVNTDRAAVRQIARELGVRYVLEGSVRRAGERVRITAQLIDGTSGAHVYANQFDGEIEDIFDAQDHITESVVGVIEPQIRQAEIERSRQKRPESLDAYDLYLQALSKLYTTRPADNSQAYAQAMHAVALEPNYAPFLATASWALLARIKSGWAPLTVDDRTTCLNLVNRALAESHGDPEVLAQSAVVLVSMGNDYDRGMRITANAVEANPNNQMVLIWAAITKIHCGDLEEALALSRRAILMNPGDAVAHFPMTSIAHAHLALRNYGEALQAAERSLAVNPDFGPTYWMLIAANAQLGKMDEARRWLAKFRVLSPGVTIARIQRGQPDKFPDRMAPILEGLRLAGLEGGS